MAIVEINCDCHYSCNVTKLFEILSVQKIIYSLSVIIVNFYVVYCCVNFFYSAYPYQKSWLRHCPGISGLSELCRCLAPEGLHRGSMTGGPRARSGPPSCDVYDRTHVRPLACAGPARFACQRVCPQPGLFGHARRVRLCMQPSAGMTCAYRPGLGIVRGLAGWLCFRAPGSSCFMPGRCVELSPELFLPGSFRPGPWPVGACGALC